MNIKKFIQDLEKRIDPIPDLLLTERLSLEELLKYQSERLVKMYRYVYVTNTGYRELYKENGLNINSVKRLEDIKKLPIIDKSTLRNSKKFNSEFLKSSQLQTGGSTGEPFSYYESTNAKFIRRNVHYRGWGYMGYTGKEKLAIVASAQGILNGENILSLNGDLTEENIKKDLNALKEFKPEFIRGYVSSLYILANYILQNSIEVKSVRGINPISENLYDFQRKAISEAFNCEVFEEYCCNDGGACAWECEHHNGLHSAMERAIIERGKDGDMIVTDLWNKATPFIRYKNGDKVEFINKECKCGRNLQLIKVKGRANDILVTKKGVISPTYVFRRWYDGSSMDSDYDYRRGIKEIQFVQEPGYILNINMVKNDTFNSNMEEQFEKDYIKLFEGMELKINYVNNIERSVKGKTTFVINNDEELLRKFSNEA